MREVALPDMITVVLARWNALSFARRLAAIIAVGVALRLIWALLVPVIPLSDSNIYWNTARNLANYGVYGVTPDKPFSYWPVGTSAIYAAFYKIFGVNMVAVIIANLIAGTLLMLTSAQLARRWFGDQAALWTAALLALWPSLIMYATVMASEVFFILAINTAILTWNMRGLPAPASSILCGVLFAAAALIRPIALLVPLLYAIVLAAQNRKIVPQIWRLAIVMVAMFACIAPWTARNYAVHHAFVLISTNGAPVLWMGNNPDSDGGYMHTSKALVPEGASEVERARILGAAAKEYMLSHPGRTILIMPRKIFQTYNRETIAVHWNMSGIEKRFGERAVTLFKILAQIYWLAILVAALAGGLLVALAAFNHRSWADKLLALISPTLVLWAYYMGIHSLIISGDRYHMPAIPFIAMLAAYAVTTALARFTQPDKGVGPIHSKGA